MKYRREEAFRYEFTEEVPCMFKIRSIISIDSSFEGKIIDISPSGIKLFSSIDLPEKKNLLLLIEFLLNENPIVINAELIWKRKVGNGYHYGLKSLSTKDETTKIVHDLKLYVKNKK